jgi:chemotaxis protein CheX
MSSQANVVRLDALVEFAARALFESHGLTLGEAQDEMSRLPDDHDIADSIGFTAPQVQGAILLTTRKDLVARAWPRELRHREPSEREVCDWAGELVNQLLGRVKNALVPFGLTLEQSTPTVVIGKHVHRAPPSTNVARRYFFETSVGSLLIYFDAAMAKGLTFSLDMSVRPGPEGDVHLF